MIRKKKILVIDDEKDLVEELGIRLESVGYGVLAAFDGLEGLEKARKDKPDLILLDVMMPTLDGYHVCRELKKDPRTQSIPIIILTVKVHDESIALGKEAGADDYVTKPYETGLLLDKIKGYLEKA